MKSVERRARGHARVAGAALLTAWALVANNITLTSGDYTSAVLEAVACSLAALALLATAWRHGSRSLRALSVVVAVPAGWAVLDAGLRRLPAVLG